MSASLFPSASSRLRLTSSFLVHRALTCLLVAAFFLAEFVCGQDPLEPWTPEPQYLPGPTEVIARTGDRAVLPCGIHNLGTKQVAWKRLDQEHFVAIGDMKWLRDDAISVDARQEDLADLTYWDLVFDPVRAEHAGVYECQISAKHKQNRHLTLRVVGPPIRKALKPGLVLKGEKYVELGQKIFLTCTAHTGPHVHQDIDWFKDGDRLVSDSKKGVVITKYNSALTKSLVSELTIDHSRATDTGTYICRTASDEIESLKVTVLNADTTNVKREEDGGGKFNLPRYDGRSTSQRHRPSTHTALLLTLTLIFAVLWRS